jgi:hypothetical protein
MCAFLVIINVVIAGIKTIGIVTTVRCIVTNGFKTAIIIIASIIAQQEIFIQLQELIMDNISQLQEVESVLLAIRIVDSA